MRRKLKRILMFFIGQSLKTCVPGFLKFIRTELQVSTAVMTSGAVKLYIALVFLATPIPSAFGYEVKNAEKFPIVVSTWPFLEAVRAAWKSVSRGFSAMDAVVEGCSACEILRCDGTVGPGGSPDENGETTIDAMIMNGVTMEVGAVAAMRYVSEGIKAARLVMQHTEHTMLAGEQASIFAISMGLPGPTNLSSQESIEKWRKWKNNKCQPNFRKNVLPVEDCGPYHTKSIFNLGEASCTNTESAVVDRSGSYKFGIHNHDTISLAVIDKLGHIAVGTSTNGATSKIPGSDIPDNSTLMSATGLVLLYLLTGGYQLAWNFDRERESTD